MSLNTQLGRTAIIALSLMAALGIANDAKAQYSSAQYPSAQPYVDQYPGTPQYQGPSGLLNQPFPNLNLPGPMLLSERLWVRGEYLLWQSEGMDSPPLITTGAAGVSVNDAGVLGVPGTRTVFGGNLNDDSVNGIRMRGGFWITPQQTFAIETEYFSLLGGLDDSFNSRGRPENIFARPFFDVGGDAPAQENAQVIRYPGQFDGHITAAVDTDLDSILVNGRIALCPGMTCGPTGHRDHVDWIVGYRRLDLDDSIVIDEAIKTTEGQLLTRDSFVTSNEFNGLQLGVAHQTNLQRIWLESLLRVAVGNNTQRATISGFTSRTENGTTDTFGSGVFALPGNSGTFERDQFTMIPEIGLTLGVRLTDWLDATVGYTVLYYPNVVRAGSIIDTDLNPGAFPPPLDPLTGAARPRFQFIETDYLAHGLSLGAELRF
jgi:hypothetical protein